MSAELIKCTGEGIHKKLGNVCNEMNITGKMNNNFRKDIIITIPKKK